LTDQDWSGLIGILLITATSGAIAWNLLTVARVEWFRERLLSERRSSRIVGMLPIAVPVFLFYFILVQPFLP
jgi:hypothetical protein